MGRTQAEAEFQAEVDRIRALRTFRVGLRTGEVETILAHSHDCTNPAGHLVFYTTNSYGVHQSRKTFNAALWLEVEEVHAQDDPHGIKH